MKHIASSNTLGVELLAILGVPTERCVGATIVLQADAAIAVHAQYWASNPDGLTGQLDSLTRKYTILAEESGLAL